jgi:aconitate hydratase
MIAAGLLARKAVERGLRVPAHVKTSLAPGSRVVTDYLDRSGLTPALEALRFHLVGYGCTTCIGNSGPLPQLVEETIEQDDLAVVAVLSGNRNFEGRIHPHVRAAYLASPPQVIAYAIAGSIRTDLTRDPLGRDRHGREVYLRDIWPSGDEIAETLNSALDTELYGREYGRIFEGDEHWKRLPVREGREFEWEAESTYVREPPFFVDLAHRVPGDIEEARVLVLLGNSVTTDHISPAGSISFSSPAGAYLRDRGVRQREFNSYGARRGNHEVMLRGTFANVRMRNRLVEREGGYTLHLPSGDVMTIFGAAQRYAAEGVPLIVIAGREYGSGSSRDWAAKGPALLGVRAVIAESFERIHRSNLVGLGILPLQFKPGESAESLGLCGRERYSIRGVNSAGPRAQVAVVASGEDGREVHFDTLCRLDSETDVQCYRAGGILLMTLRQLMP